jgi:AcrR family transcriptional regulator
MITLDSMRLSNGCSADSGHTAACAKLLSIHPNRATEVSPVAKERSKKLNRRAEILKAAEKLMLAQGLTGVTTRKISREVGCSDAALYVHFKGRVELFLAMLEESLPDMVGPLRALQQSVGQYSPQANLETAITRIYKFQARVAPLFGGLFAEPKLLNAYRKSLMLKDKGPHLAIAALERYIIAEQKLGRINRETDAGTAAYLLMSSSFFRAFVEHFFAKPMQPPWSKFAKDLIAAVLVEP